MLLTRVLAAVRRGWDRVWVLALLALLITLLPFADASPPDPLWLAGIFDDADLDEVVGAVVSASGVVRGILAVSAKPPDIPAGVVQNHGIVLDAGACSSPFTSRAPPSAKSPAAMQ